MKDTLKTCTDCQLPLALNNFTAKKKGKYGVTSRCKKCTRIDKQIYYKKNKEKINSRNREWDRNNKEKQKTPKYKDGVKKTLGIWRAKNRKKIKAHCLVAKAIRNGILKSQPCVICGNVKAHAHHEDYLKPLDIMWLCHKHHTERHVELREMVK